MSEHQEPRARLLRLLLVLVLLAGLAEAARRLLRPRPPQPTEAPWPPLEVVPSPAPAGDDPWVEPTEGTCPATHPVKAKLASGIYHLPGMLNYERTRPDRCYASAEAAEADGLRPAKR
ncbi:MAG: hypothetical protein IPM45_06380 [Acidimicrobiales bacterium]|nr:hypothetical protein [Acidimicrobiales bacterium]